MPDRYRRHDLAWLRRDWARSLATPLEPGELDAVDAWRPLGGLRMLDGIGLSASAILRHGERAGIQNGCRPPVFLTDSR